VAKTRKWKRQNYYYRKAIREAKKRKRAERRSSRGLPPLSKHRIDRRGYYEIEPPKNFSLINNPEDLLDYFDEAKQIFRRGRGVSFKLEEVTALTPDAVAIMAAMLTDKNFTRGKGLSGDAPLDPDLRKIFVTSGFYKFFKSGLSDQVFPEGTALQYRSDKQVDGPLAAQICKEAVEHTFASSEKYKPIYEILIECMANTNNHASPKGTAVYNWWLFLYKDPVTKISYFSFLDLGVGVFESLSVKGVSVEGITIKLKEILKLQHNVEFIQPLINGQIKSRTGKEERGKGWPFIYETLKLSDDIKNFILISNNVYANLSTVDYKPLKHSLRGTFIYWELHSKI
jgi:hypothetical protein